MLYNVGIMNNATTQLTIRGIEPEVKRVLVKKAKQQNISFNRYIVDTLRRSAGIDSSQKRYLAIKQFLDTHKMLESDKKAFDTAIAWADNASIKKQSKEKYDPSI